MCTYLSRINNLVELAALNQVALIHEYDNLYVKNVLIIENQANVLSMIHF